MSMSMRIRMGTGCARAWPALNMRMVVVTGTNKSYANSQLARGHVRARERVARFISRSWKAGAGLRANRLYSDKDSIAQQSKLVQGMDGKK